MGEPERPRIKQMCRTRTCMQRVASVSNTPANVSVMSKTLDLPATGEEPHVVSQKGSKAQWTCQMCAHACQVLWMAREGLHTHTPEHVRKSQDDSGNNTDALHTCTHSQNGQIDTIMAAIRAEEVSRTPKKQSTTKQLTNVAWATYKSSNTLHAQVCACLHEYR